MQREAEDRSKECSIQPNSAEPTSAIESVEHKTSSEMQFVRGLSIRLSNPNKHSNTNDPDKTEREKYHERKRDERMCVCRTM